MVTPSTMATTPPLPPLSRSEIEQQLDQLKKDTTQAVEAYNRQHEPIATLQERMLDTHSKVAQAKKKLLRTRELTRESLVLKSIKNASFSQQTEQTEQNIKNSLAELDATTTTLAISSSTPTTVSPTTNSSSATIAPSSQPSSSPFASASPATKSTASSEESSSAISTGLKGPASISEPSQSPGLRVQILTSWAPAACDDSDNGSGSDSDSDQDHDSDTPRPENATEAMLPIPSPAANNSNQDNDKCLRSSKNRRQSHSSSSPTSATSETSATSLYSSSSSTVTSLEESSTGASSLLTPTSPLSMLDNLVDQDAMVQQIEQEHSELGCALSEALQRKQAAENAKKELNDYLSRARKQRRQLEALLERTL